MVNDKMVEILLVEDNANDAELALRALERYNLSPIRCMQRDV